jgi:hypothetical protein
VSGSTDGTTSPLAKALGRVLCVVARFAIDHRVVTVVLVVAALLLFAAVGGWLLSRGKGRAGQAVRSPLLVLSWAALGATYVLARAIDALLASPMAEGEAARFGTIEETLLGGEATRFLMPLADRPAVALFLHACLWGPLLVVLFAVATKLSGVDGVRASNDPRGAPSYFRWVGCATSCGLPEHARAWLTPLTTALAISAAAGVIATPWGALIGTQPGCFSGLLRLPDPIDPSFPLSFGAAPGALALLILLVPVLLVHLKVSSPIEAEEEEKAEEAAAASPEDSDPLERLRAALAKIAKDAHLAKPTLAMAATDSVLLDWPQELPPLLREAVIAGEPAFATLRSTQAAVLSTLSAALRSDSEDRGGTGGGPTNATLGIDLRRDGVVLAGAEASGRSTALLLAALLAHLQRGGMTVLICASAVRRDELHRRATSLARRLRWSFSVVKSGFDLTEAIASGRLPSLVIADLAGLEQELLIVDRAHVQLRATDLVLVDELHELIGAAEMHATLCLRRLAILLDALGATPRATIASAGPLADEATAWASALLGKPARVVRVEGAPARERAVLRRSDLRAAPPASEGAPIQELSLASLARACELAGLPWHLRMSGDGLRAIHRSSLELGTTSEHRRTSPTEAIVALLEGSAGDVTQEVELVASVGTAVERLPDGTKPTRALVVAAPPAHEETLIAAIGAPVPRLAMPASPPPALRMIHALRALQAPPPVDLGVTAKKLAPGDAAATTGGGRGEAARAGRPIHTAGLTILAGSLRRRDLLTRLLDAGQEEEIDARIGARELVEEVLYELPPDAYQPIAERFLARGPKAKPTPDVDPACVTSEVARLIDAHSGASLRTIDADIAEGVWYPGATVLLDRGRFRVSPSLARWKRVEDSYVASPVDTALRSLAERSWRASPGSLWRLRVSDRDFGRSRLRCRSGELLVTSEISQVRLYGPAQTLAETRALTPPLEVSFSTSVLLVATGREQESDAVLRTVIATLAALLPSVLRGARATSIVTSLTADGARHLALIDALPGGTGFSRFADDELLPLLLALAHRALSGLVQDEHALATLRALFDQSPNATEASWDVPGAIAWLESLITPPSASEVTGPLTLPVEDETLVEELRSVFPAIDMYPPEERVLFTEFVRGALDSIPMVSRPGARPTRADRLQTAAGIAAVFYRRPDMKIPKEFRIEFEDGKEPTDMPGFAGYCRGTEQIVLALEPLRQAIPLDDYAIVPHEAAHLFDHLDGASDGMLDGVPAEQRARYRRFAMDELPRARQRASFMKAYAGTNIREFMACAVELFVESPQPLRDKAPIVYSMLRSALRQDPAAWCDARDRAARKKDATERGKPTA